MRPTSKLCLPLGCSSQGGRKPARDRNLFLETTLKMSHCLSPHLSLQWSFQQGAPSGLSRSYLTLGEQRSSPARASLPARGLQGHSQKKHSNTGENLSKKAHLGKLPLPQWRNEQLPLAKTCPLPFPVFPDGPETAHTAVLVRELWLNQGKEASSQSCLRKDCSLQRGLQSLSCGREDLLPQMRNG